jgi:glycine oxidase
MLSAATKEFTGSLVILHIATSPQQALSMSCFVPHAQGVHWPEMSETLDDCVIVGGGVVGLSLAVELHRHGRSVRVVSRHATRDIASWAAAGILPPPIARALHDPLEQLRDLSHRLYPRWCQQLTVESGIEVTYDRCGGVYLGRAPGERISLQAALRQWQQDGVRIETWTHEQLRTHEPNLANVPASTAICYLPDEGLVRPPRILKALRAVLQRAGVPVHEQVEAIGWPDMPQGAVGVQTTLGTLWARHVCITAGPWTRELLTLLGIDLPIEPRRGQIVLWRLPRPPVQRVINEGPRYLVPRHDGHLLVGSTVEDVGFENMTTEEGISELVRFARDLIPQLRQVEPVDQWAGLRPASLDGKPYLGPVPGHPGISVATGHFRSGIHLAPATARLMRQWICGESSDLDLSWFSITR